MHEHESKKKPTLGSLFAGIGGFDLGFERAGWKTKWQVEINPIGRAVLADRFPTAKRFSDIRHCGAHNLAPVDCITAGFPCTDISQMGQRRKGGQRGIEGASSGLFFEAHRVINEVRPNWVVLENVPALLSTNNHQDFETVIRCLADSGYLGFWRVLNAAHFGVPQNRRRIFLVAGLGRHPSLEFLADAGPVENVSSSLPEGEEPRREDGFPGYCLTAADTRSRINLGSERLVAEENGWGEMVGRQRVSRIHGFPKGLDDWNWAEAWSAGNAVCPKVAEWIARKLKL